MNDEKDELITDALWSPYPYFMVLHRMFDGGMTGLSSTQRLLYLFLLRETFGRGRQDYQGTMRELSRMTGLNKDTVNKAIKALTRHGHVDIIDLGAGQRPCCLRIHVVFQSETLPKQRGKGSLETRLAQLDAEDKTMLLNMERYLPQTEREEYNLKVLHTLNELGFEMTPEIQRQALLFLLLRDQAYHAIRVKYPGIFQYQEY
ncbi:MAG: hypothetical protein GKS05_13135 [Nitrospirales bacterium]|nr:hypothetical protein [Nitrospirales bacterium]